MYTGSYPYPTLNNAELVASLMDGERLDCPNNCPQTMYAISGVCYKLMHEGIICRHKHIVFLPDHHIFWQG